MPALTYVHLTASQLRALAHPLRNRILGVLRSDGPSTATMVAERLDSNSGKTSYHLRVLAGVGLVVEDDERGDNRDRWWRAAHDVTTYSPTEFLDDPDTRAAADFLLGRTVHFHARQLEQWVTGRDRWSREWIAASDMSDLRLRLTPQQLRALNDELLEVVNRHVADQRPDDDPDAVACTVTLAAFPNPTPAL